MIYVWIDALLNYWTAVEGSEEYWPADVHLVGKDILRFHAVIWPAMLMAAGLPLPRKVFANGWLLVGGEKMSKTKLTGIPPQQITDHFGSDAYRYYFLREIAFGQDGSFSWESMGARYQSELADQLGNLASRLTSMVERYRDGVLPAGELDAGLADGLDSGGRRRPTPPSTGWTSRRRSRRSWASSARSTATSPSASRGSWPRIRRTPTALDDVLYSTADALRAVAVLLNSFMPKACHLLWESLGAPGRARRRAHRDGRRPTTSRPGVTVRKGPILFPRLRDVSRDAVNGTTARPAARAAARSRRSTAIATSTCWPFRSRRHWRRPRPPGSRGW